MWKRTTRAKYWQALEVLPPAYMSGGNFLLGEPQDHGKCDVTGHILPRYEGYIQKGKSYFVSKRALTLPEFKKYASEFMAKGRK